MKIEGLHNHTGRWVDIVKDIDDDELDNVQEAVCSIWERPEQYLIIWGAIINTHHFSAFRVSDQP